MTALVSRSEATPQSVQKILDENAQLIRALVENMSVKGKPMECIQYQQTLHKNLVFLASLADPSVNVQALLPTPAMNPMRMPQATTSAPFSGVSSMNPSTQPLHRHPAAAMSTGVSTSQPLQWSNAQAQSLQRQQQQQAAMSMPGQFDMKGYGTPSAWGGQPGPYGIQRPGVPMGLSLEEKRRQSLRMQQEQLIQAQQARRMAQQSQGPVSTMGPGLGTGSMYPPMGMMPGSVPPGMPPVYSATGGQPPHHTMPPRGPMNM